MIIEFEGGGRILLSESAHVTWLAQLLVSIVALGEGGQGTVADVMEEQGLVPNLPPHPPLTLAG